jgi:hypothetical protein
MSANVRPCWRVLYEFTIVPILAAFRAAQWLFLWPVPRTLRLETPTGVDIDCIDGSDVCGHRCADLVSDCVRLAVNTGGLSKR